jgi:hypothetical protein
LDFPNILGFIELFQEFAEFLTGKKVNVPIVFQDCSAVVSLVTKGGGITRTKHLSACMNLGKEMVDQERVHVVYIKAAEMKADGFSKPFDPVEFKKFAKMVQGNFLASDNGWALYDIESQDVDAEED